MRGRAGGRRAEGNACVTARVRTCAALVGVRLRPVEEEEGRAEAGPGQKKIYWADDLDPSHARNLDAGHCLLMSE